MKTHPWKLNNHPYDDELWDVFKTPPEN